MNTRKIESHVLRILLKTMRTGGYVAVKVWDGGEYVPVTTDKSVTSAVFSVDESTVHFAPATDLNVWGSTGVLLICGNGIDFISDYHTGDKKFSDNMDSVMNLINAWMRLDDTPIIIDTYADAVDAVECAPWDGNNSALRGDDIWGNVGEFSIYRAASFFTYALARAECEKLLDANDAPEATNEMLRSAVKRNV